jgi:hypothetical protein
METAERPERPDEDALVEWIRHVAVSLPRDNFTVPSERAEDFLLLYGVCLQASRFGLAYLSLRETGFEREAQALARASFEHAVTAHWVYFTEGGPKRFGIAINRDFRAYFTSMGDWLDNAELRATAEKHPEAEGVGVPKFSQMLRDLGGKFLVTTYRTLSLSVHPTHATVSGYLESVDGKTELRHEPRETATFPVLYSTAISSMLALSLIEHIVEPDAVAKLLDEPSERLKLPIYIHDELPEQIRRSFS